MTKEKKLPAIIYENKAATAQLMQEISSVLSRAKRIADFWNGIGVVPPMNATIFNDLLKANAALNFDDYLFEHIKAEHAKHHGKRLAAGLNRGNYDFNQLYDSQTMHNLINALYHAKERWDYARWTVLGWDENGEPFIDGDGVEQIRHGRCCVFDNPANREALTKYTNLMTAIDEYNTMAKKRGYDHAVIKADARGKLSVMMVGLTYGYFG